MSEINFKPWVGENYETKGYKGKRILVLGESHYCPNELSEGGRCFPFCKKENMDEPCYSQTENAVDSFVNWHQKNNTYLWFERAIYGKELSQDEREDFWNSIVFYNYVQYALRVSRTRPNSDQWSKSESAFKEMLETYMPDYIIVWGIELFNKLPVMDSVVSDLSIGENDKTGVRTYIINGKKIPALQVVHPSTPGGNSWPYWHKFYEKFLSM